MRCECSIKEGKSDKVADSRPRTELNQPLRSAPIFPLPQNSFDQILANRILICKNKANPIEGDWRDEAHDESLSSDAQRGGCWAYASLAVLFL